MSTMVVKCDGVIASPQQTTVISGSIITSDTFSGGNGEIYQRKTDCKLGGSPVSWREVGYVAENMYRVQDGALQAVSNDPNFGAVGLDINLANVAVQFKITKLDVGLVDERVYFDVRRRFGLNELYRLVFSTGRVALKFRSEDRQVTSFGETTLAVGDQFLYVVKGNKHQVYINGVLKISATINSYTGEGYLSVARSALESSLTWAFDDLIVYKVD